MKELGITSGFTPTTYHPDDQVSWGQMATFAIRSWLIVNARAVTSPLYPSGRNYFSGDVPTTHGFYEYITKAVDLGIITEGCQAQPTNVFCVDYPITRGPASLLIAGGSMGKPSPNVCNGPCNLTQFQNTYWPLSFGNKWVFRNSSTLSPVSMTVQASPSTFSCVDSPVALNMYKIDPRNYWSSGYQANLRWMLGLRPNSDTIAFGHYWKTFDEYAGLAMPGTLRTDFYRSTPAPYSSYALKPPYVILRSMPAAPVDISLDYFTTSVSADQTCLLNPENPDPPSPASWHVSWSSTSISTPGYSGPAYLADITETFSGLHELWYFASGVGPVRIYQQSTNITLDLIDYEVYQNRTMAPGVRFQDALLTRAGTGRNTLLSFNTWNSYFAQLTHQPGPTPQAVCYSQALVDTPTLTVSQYVALFQNRGTSCSTDQWPEVPTVEAMASSEPNYSFGLRWDTWNQHYTGSRIAPENACMETVAYYDKALNQNLNVLPNRWILYPSRVWYALTRYRQLGGNCQ